VRGRQNGYKSHGKHVRENHTLPFLLLEMRLSLAVYAVALASLVTSYPIAKRQSGLPACAFWGGNITVPDRPVTPFIAPDQQSPVLNLSKNTLGAARLPVPAGIAGILTSGSVNITLDRLTGAQAYRVWRDANAVAWISDWGQPSLSALDSAPCDGGFYTIAAMQDSNGNDTSMGVMSLPYQIQSNGQIGTYNTPVGKVLQVRVTSYNNLGPTATGYNAQLGGCAVDPRVIPWGTYFYVPDYGYCLAIDIGTWIQDNAVDIWLPDEQAGNWGVQYRNITIVGDMANPPTSAPPTSASASTTKTASSTTTSTTSTVSTTTTTIKSTTNTKSTTTNSTTTQPTKTTTTTEASTTTTTSQVD
jgi:3D (Asp-Asp-Asp) domain-containing protein